MTGLASPPVAPAAARNAAPLLDALRVELAGADSVLEIGSGTGQHAVTFACELRHLEWQPSDLAENLPAIEAWLAETGLTNVHAPLDLDVCAAAAPDAQFDAVFSANTAHIMNFAAVERMFALVAAALREQGIFCLYGPFASAGRFSTESNANFDAALRARDADMGIRDLEDLDGLASAAGMWRERSYAMPANNLLLVWRKHPGEVTG